MKRLILLFAMFWLPAAAGAATLTGHVRFVGRPAGAAATTIVYAESLDGGRVQPGKFMLTQKSKSFVPHVLAVPVGSTVSFPNQDAILHNVFSLSRPNPFDLGLYRDGASKDRVFTTPAIYSVFCNIHPQMSATILVVPTSHIAEADAMGNYRLDLPTGRYRITAWSERAQPATIEVVVGAGSQTAPEVMLDESHFVESTHKNKYGQDYSAK